MPMVEPIQLVMATNPARITNNQNGFGSLLPTFSITPRKPPADSPALPPDFLFELVFCFSLSFVLCDAGGFMVRGQSMVGLLA